MAMRGIVNLIKNKFISFLKKQNQLTLKGHSFIHPSVKMHSAFIDGEVSIQEGCNIIYGVNISAGKPVTIGRYSSLNGPNTDVTCSLNAVTIGAFCSIARNVSIQEYNHRFDGMSSYLMHKNVFKEPVVKDLYSRGPVEIGNDVWIGSHCVVLGGTKIGDGAVVGANSVVSGEIPPYAVVAGSPAKIIKYRFSEDIVAVLSALKWWDWPIEKIIANRFLFEGKLTKEKLLELDFGGAPASVTKP